MSKKPVSRQWMLRSIRGASLADIRNVAQRDSFHNEEAFELLVERCNQLCDETPRRSVEAAQILVELSRNLGPPAPGGALCLLGTAYRRNRRYADAQAIYESALQLPLSGKARGGVLQRMAVLELFQERPESALHFADGAIELQEGARLGVALVVRSKILTVLGEVKRSVEDAGLALTLLDCKRDERSFISAVQSIANALLTGPGSSEVLRSTYGLIKRVKRQLRGGGSGRYRSMSWLYLDWIEGQINGRLGSHRQAVRQLEKVRDRFYEAGGDCYWRDALLVSIDLSVVHDISGEPELAVAESMNALDIAKALGLETEAKILAAYQERRFFVGLEREIRGIKT